MVYFAPLDTFTSFIFEVRDTISSLDSPLDRVLQSFMIQLNDARKPDILESFTFTAKCNIRVIFRCKLVHLYTGLLQPSHF